MENSTPVIFDISSDDEPDFGAAGCGSRGGVQSGDGDDCDWLSELLGQVSGNGKGDFCDDVVLVDEAFQNPAKKPRLEALNPPGKGSGEESDGDDCVVLEGDPDKPAAVAAKSKVESGGGGGDVDDDVEIIAEKGEVACRDFPHARHLCAKFLFSSTLHQVHCAQCHCYVCDSLAPCSHWGTGLSSTDHCHATDKLDYWKTERKRMKRGNNPAPPIPFTNITPPQSGLYFQPARVQPVFRPATSQPVYQVRAFRPVSMSQPPSHLLPVNSRSNVSKMAGLVGGSLPNNSHLQGYRASVNPPNRHVLQCRTGTCSVLPGQQINSQSSKSINLSYFPSQPPVYPQPSYVNSTNLMSTTMPFPSNQSVLFRPIGYTPLPTVSSSQSGAGNNSIGTEQKSTLTVMPSVQISVSNSENANQPYQPQRSYPSSLSDNLPTNFPQVSQSQNSVIDSTPDDFSLAWDSQPQDVEKIENLQNGTMGVDNTNHRQNNVAIADNPLLPTNDAGSLHDRMNSFLDSLMYDNLPLPLEIPVSPLWNDEYLP